MELHARKLSRVRAPPSQQGQPERCSSVGRALPQLFHHTLVAKTSIIWRMPKELHRAKAGSPERVQLPSLRAPRRKTTFPEGGGGAPKLFLYPCRQTQIHPANAGGTTLMVRSRVRSPPSQPGHPKRCSSAVEHITSTFHRPLVAGPENHPPANAGWNYILDVEIVGSSPTPGTMPG